MSDYETTIHAILQIPFVKDLRKKNKRLRREIKALKNLIYSLPEFRCRCEQKPHMQQNIEHNVKIKTEPGLEPTPCDTLADGDVVFVEKSRETENIVYVIDDCDVEVQVTRIQTEIQDPRTVDLTKTIVSVSNDKQAGEEAEEASEEEEEAEEASEEEEEAAQASEEEEEEEAAQADEEDVEEEEDEVEEQADEEGEVYEITIGKKSYYTTNGQNGKIYAIDADEEVGDEVGVFVNGKAKFHK
jgi:flagellar biosynthesis GTPase FlhF